MNRFLRLLTPDDLRLRRGIGGRVLWINRDVTHPDDLSNNPNILITGQANIGKTREALELIYRVVKSGMVAEEYVFEPGPELRTSDPYLLKRVLSREIKLDEPVLLFLDDLPHQFDDEQKLRNLEATLQSLQTGEALYVIATARDEHLTPEHLEWLATHNFAEKQLRGLTSEETARLIAGAVGACGVYTDYDACEYLIESNDGTPELTLLTYLRVEEPA